MKRIDYRHYICGGVTVAMVLLSVFCCMPAAFRFAEGCTDFGTSFAFYFCRIFRIPANIVPGVTVVGGKTDIIPETWNGFKDQFVAYWKSFASVESLQGYAVFLGSIVYYILKFLVIALPFVLLLVVLLRRLRKKRNTDHGKESGALRRFKRFEKRVYVPVKRWVSDFVCFIREYDKYWKAWLCVLLFDFNVFTILLEFIAYYLYLVASFDFGSLYVQVYKLFVDLTPALTKIPLVVWAFIALVLVLRRRRKIGYRRLEHRERNNRGFINERPIVMMFCATMGGKKTTTVTDFGLSTEVMFRDKAHELLVQCDLKFPNFPWLAFEMDLREKFRTHGIYNLATARRYVRNVGRCFSIVQADAKARHSWLKRCARMGKNNDFIWGYDWQRYGLFHDDALKVEYLFEVLEEYAQLYLIYVVEGSLIVGNYSTRTDGIFCDRGNFPRWDHDFFRRSSREIDEISRHARILDFDVLRLGKRMIEENEKTNSFEFGVVLITEFGKERGNTLENKGMKKDAAEANPLNDQLTNRLKMARHSATVCNYPFVKFITDEQRSMSLGAEARELFDLIHIRESSELRLHLPFFAVEELIYNIVYAKFEDWYENFRYNRGDQTLLSYLIKNVVVLLRNHYERVYNTFGYYVLHVQTEHGAMEGQYKDGKIYISTKKDYSKRFATDCFSDYFATMSESSGIGLMDYEEYKTERARLDELERQHSYFIRDLLRSRQHGA